MGRFSGVTSIFCRVPSRSSSEGERLALAALQGGGEVGDAFDGLSAGADEDVALLQARLFRGAFRHDLFHFESQFLRQIEFLSQFRGDRLRADAEEIRVFPLGRAAAEEQFAGAEGNVGRRPLDRRERERLSLAAADQFDCQRFFLRLFRRGNQVGVVRQRRSGSLQEHVVLLQAGLLRGTLGQDRVHQQALIFGQSQLCSHRGRDGVGEHADPILSLGRIRDWPTGKDSHPFAAGNGDPPALDGHPCRLGQVVDQVVRHERGRLSSPWTTIFVAPPCGFSSAAGS